MREFENETSQGIQNNGKKSNKSSIVFIIILLLIIAGLCAFIYVKKDAIFKTNEGTKTEEKESKKEEPTKKEESTKEENNNSGEKEITETAKINTLDEKVKMLSYYKASFVDPAPDLFKNISAKDMKVGEKLQTVLLYLDELGKFTNDKPSKYPNLDGELVKKDFDMPSKKSAIDLYLDDADDGYHLIKGTVVNEYYKELFGSEPTTTLVNNTYPNYYYEKAYDVYIRVARAGGTCGVDYANYNYKYTEDDNYAYVYSAVAYSSCQPEVFKDKNLKNEVAKLKTDEDDEIIEDFDEKYVKSIMDKLDKYRIVFKKDGSNFIFEKVEFVEN